MCCSRRSRRGGAWSRLGWAASPTSCIAPSSGRWCPSETPTPWRRRSPRSWRAPTTGRRWRRSAPAAAGTRARHDCRIRWRGRAGRTAGGSTMPHSAPADESQSPVLAPPRTQPTWRSRIKDFAALALPRQLLVTRGVGGARRVALTFDDGPYELTDAYLDVLDRFGARATFFVVGEECARLPETLLRIVARGHEVAGHGFSHTAFPSLSVGQLRDELERTAALLPPMPTSRRLVRPPFGATSMRSLAVSAQAGFTTVLWSRDSDDCRTTSVEEVAARLAPDALTPGEIVLLHESQKWTLATLPGALQALAAAGWQMVTVGDMLQRP